VTKSILLIFTIFLSGYLQADQVNTDRKVSKQLTVAVESLRNLLPMSLNSETQLLSVETARNLFITTSVMINYNAEELDYEILNKSVRKRVFSKICIEEKYKPFISARAIMVYRYLGKDFNFVTELSFDTKQCIKT
jgi:hypothetical protein